MDTEEHRQKVLDILENELKDRVNIYLGLTALGLWKWHGKLDHL